MPQEITSHKEILAAIKKIEAISELASNVNGHYEYELDLEVIVYGRNYSGKRVGPYVRLLTYVPGEIIVREGDWGGNTFYIVVSGRAEVYVGEGKNSSKVSEIREGVQFGEMSVLAGVPRAATVCAPADESVQVLEIQRPALRLLRKLSRFGDIMDKTYRRNGRSTIVQSLKSTIGLSPSDVLQLESISRFSVFTKNHVLFRAGEPIKNLYLIRSGWARLFTPESQGEQSSPNENDWDAISSDTYVGASNCLGTEAITHDMVWDKSCRLMGRTELLEISVSKLREYPELRETLLLAFTDPAEKQEAPETIDSVPVVASQRELIETGLVDATNLLVMDMDLCVRCGNCSLACHKMHGQSRLLRRGIHIVRPDSLKKSSKFQSLLAPAVCLHCQDPECLTGCPTGAIGRFPGGQVDINNSTCIGCADCATQCPYNAITMVPRKEPEPTAATGWKRWFDISPESLPPAVEQTDDLLAVKCNLCAGTEMNLGEHKRPAYSCEENCPTGSLLRVDPHEYFAEIKNIEGVIFKDSTHAIVRHTSHRDRGKTLLHLIGIALTLVMMTLTGVGFLNYGMETPLVWSWLDMRWLTGIVGLIGIAGVMAYPVRRSIYRRRAGPLRYWLLAHSYLGIIGGIMLLLHGGANSGGVLTTALMVSFDLVILTGLFGILTYFVVPRIMTSIEGQPLLIEDLVLRREELSRELGEMTASADDSARKFIQKRLIPRIFSTGFLLRHYLKREPLDVVTERVKNRFEKMVARLPESEWPGIAEIIKKAVMMRRVDSLIYLHQLLKLWLGPHVLFTSLMLALMVVHVIQVIYFASFQ